MKHAIIIYTLMAFTWLSYASMHHHKEGGVDGEYTTYEVDQVTRLSGGGDGINPLLPRLIEVESHWKRDAVSTKGARGVAQIMPDTGRQPGLGVKPLQGDSDAESLRFANDYLNALKARYGDDRLALAAYNCGITCVDRALKQMPLETQNYVKKITVGD